LTNSWSKAANIGGKPRVGAIGFTIGNKGYVGTGQTTAGWYLKDFWEYDPLSNVWSQKADFVGPPRFGAACFLIGNKGFVLGSDDFWEYDPSTNVWTRKADFGGVPRRGAVGFSIGNMGYIATGYSSGTSASLKDFWQYDPSQDTWIQRPDFPGLQRQFASAFSIGDKAYIVTGSSSYAPGLLRDFWEYNATDGIWKNLPDFPGDERSYAVGFSIGNKGYVGTGTYTGGDKKDFWEYDPESMIWTRKADLGGSIRQGAVAFSIGSKGYIGSGSSTGMPLTDFWEYTPTSVAVPITFINIRAYEKSDRIVLEWTVAERNDTKEYQIEKSLDGKNFVVVAKQLPEKSDKVTRYEWQDIQPYNGLNYYRVRNIDVNGKLTFSQIVRITMNENTASISIFPNPIQSNTFTLDINNKKKTNYVVKLFNHTGQILTSFTVLHSGNSSSQTIHLSTPLPESYYYLSITGDDRQQKIIKLFIAQQ